MLFILLFLFLFSSLSAQEAFTSINTSETKSILTDMGSEPSALVAGCVNVISGNYTDYEVDLTIPGPEPFYFSRSYCSNDSSDSPFLRHWQSNFQGQIHLKAIPENKNTDLELEELGMYGSRTYFKSISPFGTRNFDLYPNPSMYQKGITNVSEGVISGQNNLANSHCYFNCSDTATCTLVKGSGEILTYRGNLPREKSSFVFSQKTAVESYYMLKDIQKPSGMSFNLLQFADSTRTARVTLKNRLGQPLGELNFSETKIKKTHGVYNYTYSASAPDGRTVHYKMKNHGDGNRYALKEVQRSDGPPIFYDYKDCGYPYVDEHGKNRKNYIERIIQKNKPEGRFTAIEYYKIGKNEVAGQEIKINNQFSETFNRVKRILGPCGSDAQPITMYSFIYCASHLVSQWGTGVYDALGNKTDYYYNRSNQLESILKFHDGVNPYTHEQLYWWDKNTSKEINIKTRCFGLFGAVSKIYVKSYFYDSRGNLTLDALYGNIRGVSDTPLVVDAGGNVTQTGPDQKIKECHYSNDKMNLLTYAKEGELSRSFSYVPGTNLLASCLYWNSQGIYKRNFHEYDENALAIKSIEDNGILFESTDLTGVTLRTIVYTKRSSTYPVGLPLEVTKMYWDTETGTEKLIHREENRFDPQGRMIEKRTFDAADQFAFSQEWIYDAWGNLLVEKNPLGNTVTREYDPNGNLTKEQPPLNNTFKKFVYDYSNRLIRIDEHHPEIILSQHFKYDLVGNKIASIDAFGNQTDYQYDAFGRLLLEQGPEVLADGALMRPSTSYVYDELSNPIAITDAKGTTIKSAFTIFGKPYRIEYPDGTVQRFEYDLENRLVKEIAKNGSTTLNSYDYQGRITKKEMLDPSGTIISAQEWAYDSVHLLFEKDPSGIIISYAYDAQGRNTSITKGNCRTTLEYDLLGRVIKTTLEGVIKTVEYDILDRVIEEREEDVDGNILKQTSYTYDEIGRRIATISGAGATVRCTYDSHGIPSETIDAEGHMTKTASVFNYFNAFGQRVYKLETIDPIGIKTTTIHDTRGQPVHIITSNAYGSILHEQTTAYDILGNKVEITQIPYVNGEKLEPRIFRMEYDERSRITAFIQAAGSAQEKRTQTIYNIYDEKEASIKPDGQKIYYTYDSMGRLREYFSEDQSIYYKYHYDHNSNPDLILDLTNGTSTERKYDIYNNVIMEKLQNGIQTSFDYSPDGKIMGIFLPDQTSVHYSYQGTLLKSIERVGQSNYSHTYDTYDLSGRVLKESTICGPQTYAFSPKGHLITAESPFFTEKDTSYDYKGNLLSRSIIDSEGILNENYAYDDLGQLKAETGAWSHTYTNDSLNNRLSQDGAPHTVNLLNQLIQDKENTYSYDLSGNLIEKTSSKGTTRYSYDPLDRLIKVETPESIVNYTYDELNRCITSNDLKFFYLSQAELGACNSNGEIAQLQILGPGRRTEPCAAAVIELDHIPYAVFRDQSGHIRALVDQNNNLAMTYRYSAFGIMQEFPQSQNLNNPWTFAGKRYDPLTGLVLFGRRFYEPTTGRWITQDPAGLDAGPNLYAYLSNSPIVHYDAYGLEENEYKFAPNLQRDLENFSYSPTYTSSTYYLCRSAIAGAGKVIALATWHLVPIPYLKDGPIAVGYFMQHGTLKGHKFSFQEPRSKVITVNEDGGNASGGHVSAGGINNAPEEGLQFAKTVSNHYYGEKVRHIYTADHGFLQNIGEAMLQKIGIKTRQVRVAEKAIRLALEDAGPGPNRFVTLDLHSRGGATGHGALSYLVDEIAKMLHVHTYGSASVICDPRLASSKNYVSLGDKVTMISCPIQFTKAYLFGNPSITFLPPMQSGFDHGYHGPTYQRATADAVAEYNEFLQRVK